jgi:hypothetical protein
MVLLESRGAENADAGTDEMERAETADELSEDLQDRPELRQARPRSGEEPFGSRRFGFRKSIGVSVHASIIKEPSRRAVPLW